MAADSYCFVIDSSRYKTPSVLTVGELCEHLLSLTQCAEETGGGRGSGPHSSAKTAASFTHDVCECGCAQPTSLGIQCARYTNILGCNGG